MSYSASVAKGSNSFPLPPVPPEKKVSPASLFVLLRRSHPPGWFCEGGLLQFSSYSHTYRNGNLQPQDIRLEIQMQGKEPWIQTEQEGSLSVNTLVVERISQDLTTSRGIKSVTMFILSGPARSASRSAHERLTPESTWKRSIMFMDTAQTAQQSLRGRISSAI
ncbi:hypothetical protein FRC20_009714 [Serendipita sp. 405]|nr:hypothetical protein FRC15_009847 [Serendipita sp. 397]KAG8865537.1 hypothetical protein FRC20_009714 [Serendipita sp. 405]